MSEHDNLFAVDAVPQLFAQFGGQIDIASPDGSTAALDAMVSKETAEERATPAGRSVFRIRTATIVLDPDGEWGGVADPKNGSIVTIGELQYRAVKIIPDGCVAVLHLERQEASEIARPGYRGVAAGVDTRGRSFE